VNASVPAAAAVLFVLGAALLALGEVARRAAPSQRRADWLKYGVYVVVIGALLGAGAWGRAPAAVLLAGIAVLGALELWRNLRGRVRRAALVAVAALLLLLVALGHLVPASPAGATAVAGSGSGVWFRGYALAILLVAVTDSYSQLWGRLLGRHRLCPRLSPGKTREGLAGGLLTAVATAVALGSLMPGAPAWARAALGLTTALAAVAGDLLFSWVKRRLGVKDFSSLLPGHGGILDRFDSLIVAAPVYCWCRALLPG
jgi:phosphatidate cytidylyltransferase